MLSKQTIENHEERLEAGDSGGKGRTIVSRGIIGTRWLDMRWIVKADRNLFFSKSGLRLFADFLRINCQKFIPRRVSLKVNHE